MLRIVNQFNKSLGHLPGQIPGDPIRQHAIVDTRVSPRGKLVIWLMSHNSRLFDRLSSYGLHAIQVHYANRMVTQKFPPYLGQFVFNESILATATPRQRRLLGDHRPGAYD